MDVQKQTAVERTTVTELRLTADDIIAALSKGNSKLFKDAAVAVTFAVPTGGDYSGMTLSLSEYPLIVTIRQTVKREGK